MLILSLFQRKFGDFKIERDGSYRSNSDNLEFWLATVKGERRLTEIMKGYLISITILFLSRESPIRERP
jgi:hypothetical protein